MFPPVICVGSRLPQKRRLLSPWMLAATLAVLGSWPGLSQARAIPFTPQLLGVTISGGSIPAAAPSEALGMWTSKAGESRDDFALRVAVPLHAYTQETGFEACGVLMKENVGDRWRIRVTTNQSQMGCLPLSFDDPDFSPTRETLHTHPTSGNVTPNAHDVALFPRGGFRAGHDRYSVESADFSKRDYALGPGYLVTPGAVPFGRPHLLHQDGVSHTPRDLGRLPSLGLATTTPESEIHWPSQLVAKDDSTAASVTAINAVSSKIRP